MRKRGFTLIELLVVIAIIALLMSILLPALGKVRKLAHQMLCGTNLRGIGTAMNLYAQDYDQTYPAAGCRGGNTEWNKTDEIEDWLASNHEDAFSAGMGSDPAATITSCFFLLVKYAGVTTEQFVCKGDDATVFELSDFPVAAGQDIEDITQVWDFGPGGGTTGMGGPKPTGMYCSYSYHMPYLNPQNGRAFPVTTSDDSGTPLCADRNPAFDEDASTYYPAGTTKEVTDGEQPEWDATNQVLIDLHGALNSSAHDRNGQNVLFADIHVSFERKPNVGIQQDNIWRHWRKDWTGADGLPTAGERQASPTSDPTARDGICGGLGVDGPMHKQDAYLVCQGNTTTKPVGDIFPPQSP